MRQKNHALIGGDDWLDAKKNITHNEVLVQAPPMTLTFHIGLVSSNCFCELLNLIGL